MPDQSSKATEANDLRAKYEDFIDDFLPTLGDADHESRISYFYNDSNGHLTIGIGHLVARRGSSDAKVRAGVTAIFKYGFVRKRSLGSMEFGPSACSIVPGPLQILQAPMWIQSLHPASRAAQAAGYGELLPGVSGSPQALGAPALEFSFLQQPTIDSVTQDAIKILAVNIHYTDKAKKRHIYGAEHYSNYSNFVLGDAGIDSLGFDDTLQKIKELEAEPAFADFDNYPVNAKQAVLDLAFQYGAHGLANHTAFARAVSGGDWLTAAKQVPSGVAGAIRTEWRAKQLRQAFSTKAPWST